MRLAFCRDELSGTAMNNDSDANNFRSAHVNPPEPLVQGRSIRFREGSRLQLDRPSNTPKTLFVITLVGSLALDAQPVRCSDFVPGVSLRVRSQPLQNGWSYCDEMADVLWAQVQPQFDAWLADPRQIPGVTMEWNGVIAEFSRDSLMPLRPGVMQIDVLDEARPAL